MEKEEIGQIAAAFAADKIVIHHLEEAGLTRQYYINKLKELCEAEKTVSCVSGKGAGAGTVDFVDVPDSRVQLDAVKTIIGLYGDNAPVKSEVDFKQPITVEIVKFGKDKTSGK
jgi:hypothetical protein